MKNKYVLYTTLAFLFSGVSHAGSYTAGHGYIGLGLGKTNIDLNTANLVHPNVCEIDKTHCSVDDNDQAWQIYGGYKVSPFFSVEGAYVDLGTTADISDGALHGKQETKGVSLSAVGRAPLGKASLYGKAGIFHWNSDATVSDDVESISKSGSGTDPVIGVGVDYQFNHQWSGRIGWDRYFNIGEKSHLLSESGVHTLNKDVDVYTIGISYDF